MTHSVVAGGAGFIGNHLVKALLERGNEVTVLDNMITGSSENISRTPSGGQHLPKLKVCDCNDPVTWQTLESADEVYHLATPAAPQDYLSHPLETMKSGSFSVLYALEYCRKEGAKMLYTSTSEIYGDPLVNPQPESYWGNVNPIGPRSVYDEAKRYAEALIMATHRVHKLDTKLVRIFNTYGPKMRVLDGRAVPNFIIQALRNEPITIYGDGEQTRSFCYYKDTVCALVRVMESGDNMPYNIGNPTMMTINELAQEVIRLTKSDSGITHHPLPQDDPRVRCPDITRIRGLGWEPKWSVESGLLETIAWMREKYGT